MDQPQNAERGGQKALGQFFTPREVADFAWEMLRQWDSSLFQRPICVADPSAGEGVFLKSGLSFVHPESKFLGIDTDVRLRDRWASLGNDVECLSFLAGDGLNDAPASGFVADGFDLVIGNPPFGGRGIRDAVDGLEAPLPLFEQPLRHPHSLGAAESVLTGLVTWARDGRERRKVVEQFHNWKRNGAALGTDLKKVLQRLKRYPIEALFAERFMQLARASGWVVVIVPDGLLANVRHTRLRHWLRSEAVLRGLVQLPRGTFFQVKTSACTSLVFLQKKPAVQTTSGKSVLLASPSYSQDQLNLRDYLDRIREAVATGRKEEVCQWLAPEAVGEDRWQTGYYNPCLKIPRSRNSAFPLKRLGDFIQKITYGPIITGRKVQDETPGEVRVIGLRAILDTGIDEAAAHRVARGGVFDPPGSRPVAGDLLFPRSGIGSLGKNRMAVFAGEFEANVGCFVDLIRLERVNPYYVWCFLKTPYGFDQIRRLFNGVGTVNISFDEIRSLRIPIPPTGLQETIEQQYRAAVLPLHRAAIRKDRTTTTCAVSQASEAFLEIQRSLVKVLGLDEM